jgi:hypothetical protein
MVVCERSVCVRARADAALLVRAPRRRWQYSANCARQQHRIQTAGTRPNCMVSSKKSSNSSYSCRLASSHSGKVSASPPAAAAAAAAVGDRGDELPPGGPAALVAGMLSSSLTSAPPPAPALSPAAPGEDDVATLDSDFGMRRALRRRTVGARSACCAVRPPPAGAGAVLGLPPGTATSPFTARGANDGGAAAAVAAAGAACGGGALAAPASKRRRCRREPTSCIARGRTVSTMILRKVSTLNTATSSARSLATSCSYTVR